jgi:predicted TIM-barrel fold metal-dependent hydrolase
MSAALWNGPIVDAHQHFWDPAANLYPWLAPSARIPFRYGDYSAIKRRYLPPDYARDTAGHDVRETVYVEAEWDPADPVGETRYVRELASRFGLPNAIVAQAWLDRPDVAAVLAGQAANSLVRSVRHKPHAPNEPREAHLPSLMSNESWRLGYALLERHGLHFDLQTPYWSLWEAEHLAADFPATTIILNHTGLPADRSADGLDAWRHAMIGLARHENVVVKISGLGIPGQPWTAEANHWIVRETIAIFEPSRAMFASNFPVDSLCASFDTIFTGFKQIVADLPESIQEQLFAKTARRIYRTGAKVES